MLKKENNISLENNASDFNIKDVIFPYLIKWPWFVLSIVLCFFCSFFYLRYTVPIYNTSATILVKDDKKGGLVSELSTLSELDVFGKVKNTVDNEIEILKSRTISSYAIEELNLTAIYKAEGRIKDNDLYNLSPVKFVYDLQSIKGPINFRLSFLKNNEFELYNTDEDLKKIGVFSFGKQFTYKDVDFTVLKQANGKDLTDDINIKLISITAAAESFRNRLRVEIVSDNTSVVRLSLTDPLKKREKILLMH